MTVTYRKLDTCRICGGSLQEVLAYEPMPLANSYCEPTPHEDDYYPLTLMRCVECDLVQLCEEVSEEVLYRHDYPYVPSHSKMMVAHFDALAAKYAIPGQFVLDIGSSDGTLLDGFARRGCRVLGIDPAKNLVEIANSRGLESLAECFDDGLAERLLAIYPRPDVVTATNVVANSHQMLSFLQGVRRLLGPGGLFVMETPNFLSLMEIGSYDSIYHEHMAYFTPATLSKALSAAGLEIVELEHVPTHGGSLRTTARVGDAHRQTDGGIPDFNSFIARICRIQKDLHDFLEAACAEGKRVVGYTAPAKATVLLSQAGIEASWIEYAVDNISFKQGKLLPGLHIEIKPPEALDEGPVPDYLLVHAWNFKDEILPKLQPYIAAGAKAVIPLPALEIL